MDAAQPPGDGGLGAQAGRCVRARAAVINLTLSLRLRVDGGSRAEQEQARELTRREARKLAAGMADAFEAEGLGVTIEAVDEGLPASTWRRQGD